MILPSLSLARILCDFRNVEERKSESRVRVSSKSYIIGVRRFQTEEYECGYYGLKEWKIILKLESRV